MKTLNRWLLPKGVEEILPKQAWFINKYQREVLDLYHSWGYELVIPPMIEYQESLHVGFGMDLDLLSFRLTDQMSGRTLAVRADITPQVARIDAHSWRKEGPTRLCYSGTVLHTKPKNQLASRTPIEVGAELYGDASVSSDAEIINLMLSSIRAAGVDEIFLDLGHVGIYNQLVALSDLVEKDRDQLFEAFERKEKTAIDRILSNCPSKPLADMLKALVDLNGDASILTVARKQFVKAPPFIHAALDYLESVISIVQAMHPNVTIYIDLSELTAWQYHTGLVFSAYIDGLGHSVAKGGRYDGIGKLYGRDRPATGFTVNVNALLETIVQKPSEGLVLAPAIDEVDDELQKVIDKLRQEGSRVVHKSTQAGRPINCNRQLINTNGQWQVTSINVS